VDSDPFLDSTIAGDRTILHNDAHDSAVLGGPGEDPPSPSPKRREPLRPLTESLPHGQDSSGSDKSDAVQVPSLSPTSGVGPSPPPPPLPPKPTIDSQEEAVLYNGLVGGQQHGDWMDASRQIGGGYLHPFHLPGQYFPYQGGDHGLVPPPRMLDPRRTMPYRDSPNVYHEEAYRGHPQSTYGGFLPGFIPPGVHQNMRGSSPFFQNHQLQGPSPRTNRSPTCEPQQAYGPRPYEASAPSSSDCAK